MRICGTASQRKNLPDPMTQDTPVTSIVDRLDDAVSDTPLTARMLLDGLGTAALVPALIVPALLLVSPLSAIPLFSSFCGLAIIVIAAQGAVGRSQPWLPRFLQDRSLPAERTRTAIGVLRRMTAWLDRVSRRRLSFLVRTPLNNLLYLVCAVAAAFIPFLELVPMSSTTIGMGILLISVGILTRDGIFALLGLGVLGLASLLPWFVVTRVAMIAS